MGLLDEVRALLRREARDAKEVMGEAVADANASLDRAERRRSADPDERMAATLDDITASEDDFAGIRARADAAAARADADAELAEGEAGEGEPAQPAG